MTTHTRTILTLAIIGAWFLIGTVPFLGDYPVLDYPQMGIAAPAYKLASQGVYGNDLFTGFFGTELRNYEYMPAYPLIVTASFKLFGLGVWQARIVSVCCGLLIVWLTFKLATQLFDRATGLTAAAFLVVVRLSTAPNISGITLVDFARVIRYDILVPVFVLIACRFFLLGMASESANYNKTWNWRLAAAGLFAGMATLSHLYGAFIIPVFIAVLLWERGRRAKRGSDALAIVGGWLAGVLPWLIYVIQDISGYVGQMSRHGARFEFFDLGFYWNNLIREHGRYGMWTGGFPEGLLQVRLGFWVMVVCVIAGWVMLWKRRSSPGSIADRFTVVALPLLALQLGLFLSLKRHVYLLLLLPFIAILTAHFFVWAWHVVRRTKRAWAMAALSGVVLVTLLEGAYGIGQALRAASRTTPYEEITTAIRDVLPPSSTLLISQPFWLGLADYETRSFNLGFVMEPFVPIEDTFRTIAPDYAVIERFFIDPTIQDPRQSSAPATLEIWRRVKSYLDTDCPTTVLTIADESYGTVDVYRCDGP